MKKLIQILCSIFFATTISLPAEALANPAEDINDNADEQVAPASESDMYHQALVMGDFGFQFSSMQTAHNFGLPMIFINDPNGKMVKDAQVVTTIIDPDGRQLMNRAWPFKGGYLVSATELPPGQYRLEAEIITNGRLLTDEFSFVKS